MAKILIYTWQPLLRFNAETIEFDFRNSMIMETLRFLMVSTHYPPHHLGGDAVFVRYLADALEKRGHEVHVLCSPYVYRILRKPRHSTVGQSGSEHIHMVSSANPRIDLLKALVLGSWGHATRELENLTARLRPDVVHWHNTKGLIGRPFELESAKTLYTAHDYYLVCPRSNLLQPGLKICHTPRYCQLCCLRWSKPPPLWRLASSRVLHPSGNVTVVTPSTFTAERLSEDGIRTDFVIRNFVPEPADSYTERFENGIILYLGLLEPHKGVETLLKAFSESSGEHDLHLALVGDGSLRQYLRRQSHRLGIDKRVILPGFVTDEDLIPLRKATRIQVVPSEWPENAPLTVLEGLAYGTPLLVSNQGGLPEISEQGKVCGVFNAGDPASLSGKLLQMVTDGQALRRMSAESRNAYSSKYSPEVHINAYMKAIGTSRS